MIYVFFRDTEMSKLVTNHSRLTSPLLASLVAPKATSVEALRDIRRSCEERRVRKEYRAVVCGRVRGDAGEVGATV